VGRQDKAVFSTMRFMVGPNWMRSLIKVIVLIAVKIALMQQIAIIMSLDAYHSSEDHARFCVWYRCRWKGSRRKARGETG
jgi:hypothetical protein